MNIVYIHTHDSGRYIDPYGHNIGTPHLMNFAKEATLFRHAHCAGPTCSPSRAGLLTGRFPHEVGVLGLAHRGFPLKRKDQHLANHLKSQGYETVLCGVQHEARWNEIEGLGYEQILSDKPEKESPDTFGNKDRLNALKVAELLMKRKKSEKPFFLSFGMTHTHRPHQPNDGTLEEKIDERFITVPSPIYDNAEGRKDFAEYMVSARRMDANAGIVLKALKDHGYEDDTIIFFTTDHGIAYYKMKCNLHDTGTGVSLMVKYPGNPSAGQVKDSLVSHIDMFPTLCDLAGVKKPDWLRGKNLKPIFENESEKVNDEVFAEVTYHAGYEPMRSVRSKRYKLIRRFEEQPKLNAPNWDGGGAHKDFMLKQGFLDFKYQNTYLYDLYRDPMEGENLFGHPEYQSVANELSEKLENWMRETEDPLLQGPVPAPIGAKINSDSDEDASWPPKVIEAGMEMPPF